MLPMHGHSFKAKRLKLQGRHLCEAVQGCDLNLTSEAIWGRDLKLHHWGWKNSYKGSRHAKGASIGVGDERSERCELWNVWYGKPSVLHEAPSKASHPPRPPRLSADMRYFRCQKIIEGSIFRGLNTSQNLWGHPRPKTTKIVILTSLNEGSLLLHTSRPQIEAIKGRDLHPTSEAVWGRRQAIFQLVSLADLIILNFPPNLGKTRYAL